MNILELQEIKKYFATQKAVDDVSLTIKQGSIFGLLGPNGAGKTTLIRMITGIFYQDSGTILLDGQPFNPVNDVLKIGYMPEERGLYKKMKVGEQALYLAQLRGLSKAEAMKRIVYWFERLEMQSWWNRKVEDLSKGMSQKLQFVITVLHEPRLIILDEPFSGLDPLNANLIKDEIFRLAKKGSTIIFSTHRMEQVEEICDHIVLINLGKKILDGSVHEVKQQFKENHFKIKLDRPPLDLESEFFSALSQDQNWLKISLQTGVNSNSILTHFIQHGYTIEAFEEVLPSLNEIFIKQVEGTNATSRAFLQS
jgi:ABC-2 type transport system ATP-binding protein